MSPESAHRSWTQVSYDVVTVSRLHSVTAVLHVTCDDQRPNVTATSTTWHWSPQHLTRELHCDQCNQSVTNRAENEPS